jgi:hypothetical protein
MVQGSRLYQLGIVFGRLYALGVLLLLLLLACFGGFLESWANALKQEGAA